MAELDALITQIGEAPLDQASLAAIHAGAHIESGRGAGAVAAAIHRRIRPVLEAQKSEVSALLLGDYGANGDPIDFYLTRQGDGALALTFVGVIANRMLSIEASLALCTLLVAAEIVSDRRRAASLPGS